MNQFFIISLFGIIALCNAIKNRAQSRLLLADEPSTNALCDQEAWNIMKGDWSYNEDECILYQSESGINDLIWFGSEDGLIPNNEFVHQSFELTVTMSIESRSGSPAYSASGFFFRSTQSLAVPQGPDYWIMVYPKQNRLVFSQMNAAKAGDGDIDDLWIKLGEKDLPFDIEYGHIYTIQLVARPDYTYTVSISNDGGNQWYMIFNDAGSFTKAKDLKFGSIGLRTLNVPTTFYSVVYAPVSDSGCANADNGFEVVTDNIFACPGTFSNGLFGEEVASLCSAGYEICKSAVDAQNKGLTVDICYDENIFTDRNQFFATQETSAGNFNCYSNSDLVYIPGVTERADDIWGCCHPYTTLYPIYNRECRAKGETVFKRILANGGGQIAGDWDLGNHGGFEALNAQLTDSASGGVLCCKK